MPKRTAKFASAAFVIILAGIPLATMTHGETAPSDDCLSAPKAETPAGGHWHYRVDHANKRNCWYLRSEGGQSQAAQSTSPAPSAAKPSVADARAEFRARTSREDSPATSPPAAVNPPANAPASAPWPATPSSEATTAAVAPRWPAPATTDPASNAASGTANSADNPPQAPANLPTAAAASASADSPEPVQHGAIPGLIAAAIGALAFAGAAAVLIARRRRVRLPRHRKMSHRAPIWEMTDDDRIVLEDQPPSHNRDNGPRFARGVGSAKVQTAKVQAAKVQAPKVQPPRVQADRRPEFAPRMPRRAAR